MLTSNTVERLLGIIDWVHRTGWRTRARDQAMAQWVFNAWQNADEPFCRRETRDREMLLEALKEVFGDTHDMEGIEHLSFLYEAMFECRIEPSKRPEDNQ